ncbi:MAG TPA: hypothetical protein P5137_06830 [Candidatus Brocadiia bacterium]|nr:hypothetical protein [Candidatus Brocadiia bacterium]
MRPIPFAIITILLTLWALLAIHQRALAVRHGYAIQALERQRARILDDNRRLECEIAALTRPSRVAGEVERLGLALKDPAELTRPQKTAKKPAAAARP